MWEDYTSPGDLAIGPQSDGTNLPASASIQISPVDAGGGAPAGYSKDILDVFKFGVGVWQQNRQQQNLLEYKRYEATQGGLFKQGVPATFSTGTQGGRSNLLIGAAILIAAVVLLQSKA